MNEEKIDTKDKKDNNEKIGIPVEWTRKFTLATAVQFCLLTLALLIAMPGLSHLLKTFSRLGIQLPTPSVLILKGYIAIITGIIACVLFVARAKGGSIISFILSIIAQFTFVMFSGIMMIGIFLPIVQISMRLSFV
ncbi:MAG: hypothetical protein K8T10_17330 [Candidatus Eremiobacteraeota bacterium]|nr:hypothetical protein [Candidatus Eremiobacteraeota bacterium]